MSADWEDVGHWTRRVLVRVNIYEGETAASKSRAQTAATEGGLVLPAAGEVGMLGMEWLVKYRLPYFSVSAML